MSRLYLDHNATSPLKPEVRAAMLEAMDRATNASSIHAEGQWARRKVNEAREEIAALTGAKPDQVYFTSGATEANNWVLRHARRPVVSAIEHPSVREAAPDAALIPVGHDGVADLAALDALLGGQATTLVSLMLVNNETGIVQPVRQAAEIAHRHGARLHVDAVQAPGRIGVDVEALGADYLTLSAHKLGGPQGMGALIMAGIADLPPWMLGGRQENRRRAGTENVAGAIGFGVAARLAQDHAAENMRLAALRDSLEDRLATSAPELLAIGRQSPRVGNTSLLALPGLPAETQVIALDMDGISVSAGAACSSGKVEPSPVLAAMGYDETISRCAIRVSLGWTNGHADIARFIASWQKLHSRHAGRIAQAG